MSETLPISVMSSFHPVEQSYWLERLCEMNYVRLIRLIPGLRGLTTDVLRLASFGRPVLHLKVIERSPYTMSLELTHRFGTHDREESPASRVRVCFDANTVEALSDAENPFIWEKLDVSRPHLVLEYKWRQNYFLARWLEHCLQNHYRFESSP